VYETPVVSEVSCLSVLTLLSFVKVFPSPPPASSSNGELVLVPVGVAFVLKYTAGDLAVFFCHVMESKQAVTEISELQYKIVLHPVPKYNTFWEFTLNYCLNVNNKVDFEMFCPH
jgi:hypothetical protein